jgi:hypothetical protein
MIPHPEIVRRVEGLFAPADRIEAWLVQVRAQVEKLTPLWVAKTSSRRQSFHAREGLKKKQRPTMRWTDEDKEYKG